jgi:CheY-like chemotaxis protein
MGGFRRKFEREVVSPTLLLVETSIDSTAIFETRFSKVAQHWQFVTVEDGAAAVHHMTVHGLPDVLATCLETPHFGAVDLAEWVRSMKAPRPVHIVIYDPAPETAIRERLEQLEVHDFLDKQAPEESFRRTMQRVVARAELTSASRATSPAP